MPFDNDQELRDKFRADDEDRPPNFLWFGAAIVVSLLMWGGILWLLGVL